MSGASPWQIRPLRVLLPPALFAALLWLFGQTTPGRRTLVWLSDPSPAEAATSDLTELSPVFDGPDAQRARIAVRLQPVVSGIPQPTDVAFVPGQPDRAVILGKQGNAFLVRPSTGESTLWFTLDVATSSELGLLGIAFHPDFARNGLFFVDATPSLGGPSRRIATSILRMKTDPATLGAPTVEGTVLEVEQPYQNHNGGQIAFGPDRMLYIALGDGGFRDDPHGNGQNLGTLLGKILRIDISVPPYRIPPDNPFAGQPGAKPEIWAYGLRNPWRFSFDPRGRMVAGDVGQNRLEEIDLVAKGDNLGWKIREADRCFEPSEGCETSGLVEPIWRYGRDEGISVTGGVVCTGSGPLSGRYLFGDFGTGRLWALELPEAPRMLESVTALGRFSFSPSAFTCTPDGEVWVTDYGRGGVYRIAPAP